ncbi:MAG: ferritin family protein [Phycisphaeraceae bacterium]|nr:ferritin family protein [Phycisphaeraceae bacterium]
MSITFNVDEIFEMAEQIERNGARFYRDAAAQVPDKQTRAFLESLGEMEDTHLTIFTTMRSGLTESANDIITYDPDDQGAQYLQAMADAHGTEGRISVEQPLTGKETLEEILQLALAAEKNSICFYIGLKDLVPSDSGKTQVDHIIKEEMGHIAILQTKLTAQNP